MHMYFSLQKIVSHYYEEYGYQNLLDDLNGAKEVGNEFTLLLASKWLWQNITVVTLEKDWSAYTHCSPDIVLTYKGKDRFGRGKWTSSQLIGHPTVTRSKSASEYHFIDNILH